MDSYASKTLILKKAILSRYKSIRQFAGEMEIPYSTLVTALERGIEGMAYSTVIRMCENLHLNPIDFSPLDSGGTVSEQITTRKVMDRYNRFNRAGREKIMGIMDDYLQISAYVRMTDME